VLAGWKGSCKDALPGWLGERYRIHNMGLVLGWLEEPI